MSIRKQNIDAPDILRTFDFNSDLFKVIDALFFTLPDFSFTEDEFSDDDFWYDNLGINIFPAHNICEFTPEDTKNTLAESLQDFTNKLRIGKYKERVLFNWSLAHHQLFTEFNGQELRVIQASGQMLRGTEVDDDDIRGFLLSAFELEPIARTLKTSTGNSELFLEHFDSDELNVSGYEVEVDWNPKDIDRLFLNIDLSFSEDQIIMSLKYDNEGVDDVANSDVTITDETNGDISFNMAGLGSGSYKLNAFDKKITRACLYVQSTLYIGRKKFTFTYTVVIISNMVWGDGNGMMWANYNKMVFAEK